MYIASGSAARAPSSKATEGEVGVSSRSKSSNAVVEVAGDQRPDALRLPVVGVVVARGERVGAEHDPPLDLVAEALRARLLVHRRQVVGLHAVAEADAVEAGQVGRGLGRGEHVVGGDPVLGVRQRASRRPRRRATRKLERALEDLADAGLDALCVAGQLPWNAEPQAVEALGGRHRDAAVDPGAGRVVAVGAPASPRASVPRRRRSWSAGRTGRARRRRRSSRSARSSRRSASGRRSRRAPPAGGSSRRCRCRSRRAPSRRRPPRPSRPEEPPGTRVRSHGLRTGPKPEFSFEEPIANSSMFVLPSTAPPACSSCWTAVAV